MIIVKVNKCYTGNKNFTYGFLVSLDLLVLTGGRVRRSRLYRSRGRGFCFQGLGRLCILLYRYFFSFFRHDRGMKEGGK